MVQLDVNSRRKKVREVLDRKKPEAKPGPLINGRTQEEFIADVSEVMDPKNKNKYLPKDSPNPFAKLHNMEVAAKRKYKQPVQLIHLDGNKWEYRPIGKDPGKARNDAVRPNKAPIATSDTDSTTNDEKELEIAPKDVSKFFRDNQRRTYRGGGSEYRPRPWDAGDRSWTRR